MVTYDTITVVFEAELNMLELQAISMRRLAHVQDIGKIIIINNAGTEELIPFVNQKINEIIPLYGDLASKVEIYTVVDMIGKCYSHIGWQVQQLLKLMACEFVTSPVTLIMDAKNFFTQPFGISNLIFDNKPRRLTKPLLKWSLKELNYACDLFDLDENQRNDMITNFKEIHTPFIIWSDTFKSCIKHLCESKGKTLQEIFTFEPLDTFEFYVLEAYIAKTYGLNNYFYDADLVGAFRVHRRDYLNTPEKIKQSEAQAWVQHGIFDTVEESLYQIEKILKNSLM